MLPKRKSSCDVRLAAIFARFVRLSAIFERIFARIVRTCCLFARTLQKSCKALTSLAEFSYKKSKILARKSLLPKRKSSYDVRWASFVRFIRLRPYDTIFQQFRSDTLRFQLVWLAIVSLKISVHTIRLVGQVEIEKCRIKVVEKSYHADAA